MDLESWKKLRTISDPAIMGGKRVFVGTRVTVENVGRQAARVDVEEILEDYPSLSIDDVHMVAMNWKVL